jgi:hypothetical protein
MLCSSQLYLVFSPNGVGFQKEKARPKMAAQAYNPSTWEAEERSPPD